MRYFFFLLCLTQSFYSFSQSRFKHYTTSDGLPNNLCYLIIQDHQGYLWIGTDDGLSKFNGKTFKNFRTNNGLKSNYTITPIEVNKKLIVSTWGSGLHIKKGTSFNQLVVNDSVSKINNLTYANNKLWSVNTSRNFMFQQLNDSLYRKKSFAIKLRDGSPQFAINSAHNDFSIQFKNIDGSLFITNGLLYKREKLKGIYEINSFDSIIPRFNFMKNEVINGIIKKDEYYIINNETDIFITTKTQIIDTIKPKIKDEILERVIPYADKYLILSLGSDKVKHVKIIDKSGRVTNNLSETLQIESNISDVLIDNEMNIWVSTYGQGLFCVFANEKIQYTDVIGTENRLIKDITNIYDTNFLLSDSKLFIAKDQEINATYTILNSPNNLSVSDTILSVNSIGTSTHLNIEEEKIEEQQATLIIEDNDVGKIIIKTDSLLIPKLDKKIIDRRFLYLLINDVIHFNNITYVATNDGLITFSEKENSITFKGQVNTLLKDNDTLWIGTNKGLLKHFNQTTTTYNTTNNLLSNTINALCKDKKGKLWIGSNLGLSTLKKDSIKNLYLNNSVKSKYITALNEDNKGNIWVGTNNGAFVIENTISIPQESAPLLVVEQENSHQFIVDVITFNRSDAYTLQFKLKNMSWESSKSQSFDFSNYSQGDYSVSFRAKKQDGIWGYSEPFIFKIRLPWYQQNYFYGIILVLVFSTIVFFISRRLRLIKKRNIILSDVINKKNTLEVELNDVRENIARDFHDNFGNKLARISMISNYMLASKKTSINEDTSDAIHKIKNDAEDLYEGTKDFMFALKTNSDYISEVINYLGDFSLEFLESYTIDFKLINSIQKDFKLPHYWNRQIILIFKEAITNIAKHSKSKNASLTFTLSSNKLEIICLDDGCGFDINSVSSSGLKNMQKRAKSINASLIITSNKNKGTKVHFKGLISN